MFPKENNFSWSTDKPFPGTKFCIFLNCKFLDGSRDGILTIRFSNSDIPILSLVELNGAGGKQSALEVI